ncbi:MAG: zinc-dependent alcohol dehydrogenase [Planctomycetota bacterium]|nr:zinc-dependent alcohol dehydrogenase [Planctomycetota bacterium]
MRAVCWQSAKELRVEDVPDPEIINPRDAIVRVTSTAICGSDLHLFNGFFPGMKRGDIMGHEAMGEVVAVGRGVRNLREGDRVVIPCVIACGACVFCKQHSYSACDNSNAKPIESAAVLGYPGSGMFGYSEVTGSYAGGQAEMVRVPFADFGLLKVPDNVPDERVLFISDILPTGWMGAANCDVKPGDVVAVWGAGPVGQMAIHALKLMGAERIIVIDRVAHRLRVAQSAGAEIFNLEEGDVYEHLLDETAGRGPDSCLDAVGMEAHGQGFLGVVDRVKQSLGVETDRPAVIRQAIRCVRKGGTISLLGVYAGVLDTFPLGVAFNKGVTFKMGQVRVQALQHMLLNLILKEHLDPSSIITHVMDLEDAVDGYDKFNDKEDACLKVVLKPGLGRSTTREKQAAASAA